MGKVFSFEEIESRQIPQLESFDHVANLFRQFVAEIESIRDALIYGSYFIHHHNARSDFDCLAIFDGNEQEIFSGLAAISDQARQLFVPFAILLIDSRLRRLAIDADVAFGSYLYEIKHRSGGLKDSSVWFSLQLAFEPNSRKEVVENFLCHKIRKITSELVTANNGSEDYYLLLQKALEAPARLCRKIAWYVDGENSPHMQPILHSVGKIIETKRARELFSLDRWYTKQLLKQLEHSNEIRYQKVLQRLEENVWEVLDFLGEIANYFNRLR